ncbi:uncharacterized protein BJ212DRAFT_1376418, partial [Suillus subaureus]
MLILTVEPALYFLIPLQNCVRCFPAPGTSESLKKVSVSITRQSQTDFSITTNPFEFTISLTQYAFPANCYICI